MATTIWKATVNPEHSLQQIEIPMGAEILCAREQFDLIGIWFRCDPNAEKETRDIFVCATGATVPGGAQRYLGTASILSGTLIYHVFERTSSPRR